MSRRGLYKCQPLSSSVHASLGELRPSLYTYRLNWDSKFAPWFSKADHTTSLSQRLPTMLIVYEWAEKNVRTPDFTSSDVTGIRRNHYTRSQPVIYDNCSVARLKSQNYCLHNLHRWEAVIDTLSASVEPVSTRRWLNAVWMLHHRLQHKSTIKPALGKIVWIDIYKAFTGWMLWTTGFRIKNRDHTRWLTSRRFHQGQNANQWLRLKAAGSFCARCLWRWPNIKPTLGQRFAFVEYLTKILNLSFRPVWSFRCMTIQVKDNIIFWAINVLDQLWLVVRCHPEWEFGPQSFSHSWTIQGTESTCSSGNCRCFTDIWQKLYMTYGRFFSDLEKSSIIHISAHWVVKFWAISIYLISTESYPHRLSRECNIYSVRSLENAQVKSK